MNKEITLETTSSVISPLSLVSDIVRNDYRTAPVFRKFNINYCCAGKVSLREICNSMGISESDVLDNLQEVTRNLRLHSGLQFNEWKTDFLIDYLVNVHHAYLYKSLPEILDGLISFMNQHNKKYPELTEIFDTFKRLSELLIAHNRNEEEVIFPYIMRLDSAFSEGETYAQLFVRTLRKSLTSVHADHEKIAALLKKIQVLTNNYNVPENACTNHGVVYGKLREFHDDLVQHKHLENNILLPRAAEIERVLLSY